MDAREIIIRPVITEKSTQLIEEGKYTFVVDKRANKYQIADAIREIFKVKVNKVTTMNCLGKARRVGRNVGKRPDYKKAVVRLAPGETIEFFQAK